MTDPIDWRCACGAVHARVDLRGGSHIVCHCRFCRGFAKALDRPDLIGDAGGCDLFQTMPDRIDLVTGQDQLACLRLSSKGPVRWYTKCCNTPFCNTLAKRFPPFATIIAGPDANAYGPVWAHVFVDQATGPVSEPEGTGRVIRATMGRMAAATLRGGWKSTPFFTDAGKPLSEPRKLTPNEKARALG